MFGFSTKTVDETPRVTAAAEKAAFRNFNHAAASISKDAKSSLETTDGPSEPGTPPHTHRGAILRRAIRYDATKEGAVIGPLASVVGQAGEAQELGGNYKGEEYPARPFMGPALERAVPRLESDWSGSIGD